VDPANWTVLLLSAIVHSLHWTHEGGALLSLLAIGRRAILAMASKQHQPLLLSGTKPIQYLLAPDGNLKVRVQGKFKNDRLLDRKLFRIGLR